MATDQPALERRKVRQVLLAIAQDAGVEAWQRTDGVQDRELVFSHQVERFGGVRQGHECRYECVEHVRVRVPILGQVRSYFGCVLSGVNAKKFFAKTPQTPRRLPLRQRSQRIASFAVAAEHNVADVQQIDAYREARLRAAFDALGDGADLAMLAGEEHQNLRGLRIVEPPQHHCFIVDQRHNTIVRRSATTCRG